MPPSSQPWPDPWTLGGSCPGTREDLGRWVSQGLCCGQSVPTVASTVSLPPQNRKWRPHKPPVSPGAACAWARCLSTWELFRISTEALFSVLTPRFPTWGPGGAGSSRKHSPCPLPLQGISPCLPGGRERYSSEPISRPQKPGNGRPWVAGWPWLSVCLSGRGWPAVTAPPRESWRRRRDFQNQTGNWLLGLVAEATALGDHGMGLELG